MNNLLILQNLPTRIVLGLFFTSAVFASIFFVTRGEVSQSELAFVEHSSQSSILGSVVPASCNSVPPTNHNGDCPLQIDVNLAPTGQGVSVSHSVVQFPGTAGGTFSWNSSGATKCSGSWEGSWLPPSGNNVIWNTGSYTFSCTNGVEWSAPTSFTVVSVPVGIGG